MPPEPGVLDNLQVGSHKNMADESRQELHEDRAFLSGSEVKEHGRRTTSGSQKNGSINVVSVWLEVTSCALGLISIAAMVATLYPHQDKPIPQWPFQISINTLLSIYSFVLKLVIPVVVASCLGQLQWGWFVRERPLLDLVRYNSAANGALGSAQWLWSNHIREPLTALGAVVTILSIIIDPFVQQLIVYEDCSTVVNAVASVPRTDFFESFGGHLGPGEETIEPGVQNAINAGLFGSKETISPECLTGNCTFTQQYASIGYCSACQDISDQVKVNFTFVNHTFSQNDDPNLLTSTLPSGLFTEWDYAAENNNVDQMLFAGLVVLNDNNRERNLQFLQGATYFTQNGLNPTTLEPQEGCTSAQANSTLWQCRHANAVSCRFEPCVRVYNASVTEGQFIETVVDSSSVDQSWGKGGSDSSANLLSLVDTQCTTSQQNASLAKLGYKLTGRWLGYNSTLTQNELDNFMANSNSNSNDTFPQSLYARQCVYTISATFEGSLWTDYLYSLFTGNVTAEVTQFYSLSNTIGPQSLKTLYNNSYLDFDSIQGTIQNMSESMTNYMRLNGQANHSAPATGEVLHSATCLHVRWPWITLPLSLAIATCLLFALTVFKVNKSNTPVWKSSLLPTLFNGPALRPERQLGTERDMEKEAAKTVIVLDGDPNNGFQLVQARR